MDLSPSTHSSLQFPHPARPAAYQQACNWCQYKDWSCQLFTVDMDTDHISLNTYCWTTSVLQKKIDHAYCKVNYRSYIAGLSRGSLWEAIAKLRLTEVQCIWCDCKAVSNCFQSCFPHKKMEETLFLVLCQTQCGKKSMEVLGKKGTIADLTAAITFVPVHRNP